MGAIANAKHEQAIEDAAEGLEELICKQFLVGSDALGPDGWGHVAGTFRELAGLFAAAAKRAEANQAKSEEGGRLVCRDARAHGELLELIRQSGEDWEYIGGLRDYAPQCVPCFGAVGPYPAVWHSASHDEYRCSGCLDYALRHPEKAIEERRMVPLLAPLEVLQQPDAVCPTCGGEVSGEPF